MQTFIQTTNCLHLSRRRKSFRFPLDETGMRTRDRRVGNTVKEKMEGVVAEYLLMLWWTTKLRFVTKKNVSEIFLVAEINQKRWNTHLAQYVFSRAPGSFGFILTGPLKNVLNILERVYPDIMFHAMCGEFSSKKRVNFEPAKKITHINNNIFPHRPQWDCPWCEYHTLSLKFHKKCTD